jgi:uncharacterized protein with NAD-binding domain and iron-sulfur cluster
MKKKIAILGGGCASMTAAYYLSNTPELRNALDITVYQMGWRLGGKGASGRRADMFDRIEEHGLHVWGGFYYNAFRMMRECYGALNRPPGPALTDVWNTFVPHDIVAWGEEVNDKWLNWILHVPSDSGKPGEGSEYPSLWRQLERIIGWIRDAIFDWPHEHVQSAARDPLSFRHEFRLVEEAFEEVTETTAIAALDALVLVTSRLAEQSEQDHAASDYAKVVMLVRSIDSWAEKMILKIIDSHDESRRIFVLVDLGLALVSGIIADRLYSAGFMTVDDYDLADWLGKHGATKETLASAPLRGYYDYFFAYEDGDVNKPRMSAGMGVAHLLRLVAGYKGSLFWKMQSGMGDAVFAPIYQLCRENGVKFEFFHRVDAIVPTSDGKSIATIRINKQVTLKDGTYDPLVFPKSVPSWPSEPNWKFINDDEVAKIRTGGVNLEDPWADWKGSEVELHSGVDFDAAVLGLSIGAFGMVCRDIVATNATWATMVEKLQTIQTQALQLWFKKDVAGLGWSDGNTTGTAYAQPLESWSDMTGALGRETWPEGADKPQSVIYFCGPMQNPPAMPSGVDPQYGRSQGQKADENADAWAKANLPTLYPSMTPADEVSRYTRANYTPTERYVIDLPGTNQYRLEANTSGYDNLALAGDWLFTGLGGAVESAVISGMQAARALAGTISDPIVGEVKSPWPRKVSVKPLVSPLAPLAESGERS